VAARAPILPTANPNLDDQSLRVWKRNVQRVADAVTVHHMFGGAMEAACRVLVNEAKNRSRALAWNDVSGNLRNSITYQVEGVKGPEPIAAEDGSGDTYNTETYQSGKPRARGTYAVVFAPPDYAINVETNETRSVLLEPTHTVQRAMFEAMGRQGKRDFAEWVFRDRALLELARP